MEISKKIAEHTTLQQEISMIIGNAMFQDTLIFFYQGPFARSTGRKIFSLVRRLHLLLVVTELDRKYLFTS